MQCSQQHCLHVAHPFNRNTVILQLLLRHLEDVWGQEAARSAVNQLDLSGWCALRYACAYGNEAAVELLLGVPCADKSIEPAAAAAADPTAAADAGSPGLQQTGQLSMRADPTGNSKRPALAEAAGKGYARICKLLLTAGAKVSQSVLPLVHQMCRNILVKSMVLVWCRAAGQTQHGTGRSLHIHRSCKPCWMYTRLDTYNSITPGYDCELTALAAGRPAGRGWYPRTWLCSHSGCQHRNSGAAAERAGKSWGAGHSAEAQGHVRCHLFQSHTAAAGTHQSSGLCICNVWCKHDRAYYHAQVSVGVVCCETPAGAVPSNLNCRMHS